MKNNKVLLIIVILLSLMVGVLLMTRKSGTLKKELSDFAVKDTAAINKIFMANRKGRSVLLERKNNHWKLNGKFDVRRDAIQTLLYTIYAVQMKSPVAKAAHNNVIKRLAAGATKIEIYQHDKLVKTYYIGDATQDQLGTFMILENSSEPFVVDIPGFNGYLTPRYFVDEDDWKDPLFFRYGPDEISSVKLIDHQHPSNSFIIEENNKHYYLKDSLGKEYPCNETNLKSYLLNYKKMGVQNFLQNRDIDSAFKTRPFVSIEVKDSQGKVRMVDLYYVPNFTGKIDDKGKLYKYDPEQVYLRIDKNVGALGQYLVLNGILRSREELLNK